MLCLQAGDLTVEFDHLGDLTFNKSGIVNWLGKPVIIRRGRYIFYFDLEGRVQRIDGLEGHPWDWIQRTMANDWIYYDKVWVPHSLPEPSRFTGDWYWTVNGRADLPLLRNHGGLKRDSVRRAFQAFDDLIATLRVLADQRPPVRAESRQPECTRLWDFLGKAARHDQAELQKIADRLHAIHGTMEVLPPDTIHVDYRVLLVKLMDGCRNNCGFCAVRGDAAFALRDKDDIDRQIERLANLYGDDLCNYNSVVFGECDALISPLIEHAARKAFETFHCGSSVHAGSNLFMFATTETLSEQPDTTFKMLQNLPFQNIYINVGWEAATDAALSRLQKQQTARDVLRSMEKAGHINTAQSKIVVSGNFISADWLESNSIVDAINTSGFAGPLYLSPLLGACTHEQAARDLQAIRQASARVKARLYTMQRM